MGINLVDDENARLVVHSFGEAIISSIANEQMSQPLNDRLGALAQGVKGHSAIYRAELGKEAVIILSDTGEFDRKTVGDFRCYLPYFCDYIAECWLLPQNRNDSRGQRSPESPLRH